MVRRQFVAALRMLAVMTLLLGVVYPAIVTVLTLGIFPAQARGSVVEGESGAVVGSVLVAQSFTESRYFHPRPSAVGFDGAASGGSNLGPTNPELVALVEARVLAYRERNALPPDSPVPVDAVTASASGLDPHISVANAMLQAPRVAAARGVSLDAILSAIDDLKESPQFGFLDEPVVNVLRLNLELDR